jgi:hypothetical protein
MSRAQENLLIDDSKAKASAEIPRECDLDPKGALFECMNGPKADEMKPVRKQRTFVMVDKPLPVSMPHSR